LQNFTQIVKFIQDMRPVQGGVVNAKLIQFLQEELAIPDTSIAIALRQQRESTPNMIPMILWQYGLITLEDLDKIFDWMEKA
jgi:hypothetical protein